jgi:carboxypeptidase PM20D1
MKSVKLILLILALFTVLAIAFLVFNAIRFRSIQGQSIVVKPADLSLQSIKNFQRIIQFKTITYDDSSQFDSSAFIGLRNFLAEAYPEVHKKLRREIVGRYSLLFHWPGKLSNQKAVVFIAHMDVVPVESESLSQWKTDPFSGEVKNDSLWGRGAVDDKINMVAVLESIEKLIKEDYKPDCSIFLVFGHDEEAGGLKGAKPIADLLKKRKLKADLILDEGGHITIGKIPNLTKPLALLGTSEKGFLNLTLTVRVPGGHSSFPEKETAIDILSSAIVRIRETPFPARLTSSTKDFIASIGPELPFLQKLAFANSNLFEKLIAKMYEKSPQGNAMMRTNAVATVIAGGIKENAVPGVATTNINLRLLPGDSIDWVIRRIKETIDDPRVEVIVANGREASGYTSIKSEGYRAVEKAIRKTFDSTLTAPFLLIGGTDSKHFEELGTAIVRFSPMIGWEGAHGVNERVSLKGYQSAIWFYEQLIRDVSK